MIVACITHRYLLWWLLGEPIDIAIHLNIQKDCKVICAGCGDTSFSPFTEINLVIALSKCARNLITTPTNTCYWRQEHFTLVR